MGTTKKGIIKPGKTTDMFEFGKPAAPLPVADSIACASSARLEEPPNDEIIAAVTNLDRASITPPTIAQVQATFGHIPDELMEKIQAIRRETELPNFRDYTRLNTHELAPLYVVSADGYVVPRTEYLDVINRSISPSGDPELYRFGAAAFAYKEALPPKPVLTKLPFVPGIEYAPIGLFSKLQFEKNPELLNASVQKLLWYAADPIVNSPICLYDIECYPNISFLRYVVFCPNGHILHNTVEISNNRRMKELLAFFATDPKMIIIAHNAAGYDGHMLQYGAVEQVTPEKLFKFSKALISYTKRGLTPDENGGEWLIYTVYTHNGGSFRVYDTVSLFPGIETKSAGRPEGFGQVGKKTNWGRREIPRRIYTGIKTIAFIVGLTSYTTPHSFEKPINTIQELQSVIEYCTSDVDVLIVLVAEKFEVIKASMAHARLYKLPTPIQRAPTRAQALVNRFVRNHPPRGSVYNVPEYPLNYTHPRTLALRAQYTAHPDANSIGNLVESIPGTGLNLSLNDGGIHSSGYTEKIMWGYKDHNPKIMALQLDIRSFYPFAMNQWWVKPCGLTTFNQFVEELYRTRTLLKGKWGADPYFKLVINSLSGLFRASHIKNGIADPVMGRMLTRNLSLFMFEVVIRLAEAGFPAFEVNTDGFSVLFDSSKTSPEDFQSIMRYQLSEACKSFGEFQPVWEGTIYDRGIFNNVSNYIVREFGTNRVKAKGSAFLPLSLENTSGGALSGLFQRCFVAGVPFTTEALKEEPIESFYRVVKGLIKPEVGVDAQSHTIVITTDDTSVLYSPRRSGPVDPRTGVKGITFARLTKQSQGYCLADQYRPGSSPPLNYAYYMEPYEF